MPLPALLVTFLEGLIALLPQLWQDFIEARRERREEAKAKKEKEKKDAKLLEDAIDSGDVDAIGDAIRRRLCDEKR